MFIFRMARIEECFHLGSCHLVALTCFSSVEKVTVIKIVLEILSYLKIRIDSREKRVEDILPLLQEILSLLSKVLFSMILV